MSEEEGGGNRGSKTKRERVGIIGGCKNILCSFRNEDSFVGATFNIMNNTVGTGIIFLPGVLYEMGLYVGILMLLLVGIMNGVSTFLLYLALNQLRSEGKRPCTLSESGGIAFGKFVGWAIKIICALDCFGGVLSFQIVLTTMILELLSSVFPSIPFFQTESEYRTIIFVVTSVVMFVATYILSLAKDFRNLRIISTISIALVVIFFLSVVLLFVTGFTSTFAKGEPIFFPNFQNYRTYLRIISNAGVLTFSHISLCICNIHSEFQEENLKHVGLSIIYAYPLVFVIYAIISLTGYLSFLDNTRKDNFVLGYKGSGWISITLHLLIFVEVLLSYPVWSYVIVKEVDTFVEYITDFPKNYFWKLQDRKANIEMFERMRNMDIALSPSPSLTSLHSSMYEVDYVNGNGVSRRSSLTSSNLIPGSINPPSSHHHHHHMKMDKKNMTVRNQIEEHHRQQKQLERRKKYTLLKKSRITEEDDEDEDEDEKEEVEEDREEEDGEIDNSIFSNHEYPNRPSHLQNGFMEGPSHRNNNQNNIMNVNNNNGNPNRSIVPYDPSVGKLPHTPLDSFSSSGGGGCEGTDFVVSRDTTIEELMKGIEETTPPMSDDGIGSGGNYDDPEPTIPILPPVGLPQFGPPGSYIFDQQPQPNDDHQIINRPVTIVTNGNGNTHYYSDDNENGYTYSSSSSSSEEESGEEENQQQQEEEEEEEEGEYDVDTDDRHPQFMYPYSYPSSLSSSSSMEDLDSYYSDYDGVDEIHPSLASTEDELGEVGEYLDYMTIRTRLDLEDDVYERELKRKKLERERKWNTFRFNCISLFLVTFFASFFGMIYPDVRKIVGYCGSITGISLCYLIPVVIYLKVVKPGWCTYTLVVTYMFFCLLFMGILPTIIQTLLEMGLVL